MMHCRVDKGKSESRIDEFFDDFLEHLTLNIPYLSTKEGPIDRAKRLGVEGQGELGVSGKSVPDDSGLRVNVCRCTTVLRFRIYRR